MQELSAITKSHQEPAGVIRSYQELSGAIKSHQEQEEPWKGNGQHAAIKLHIWSLIAASYMIVVVMERIPKNLSWDWSLSMKVI